MVFVDNLVRRRSSATVTTWCVGAAVQLLLLPSPPTQPAWHEWNHAPLVSSFVCTRSSRPSFVLSCSADLVVLKNGRVKVFAADAKWALNPSPFPVYAQARVFATATNVVLQELAIRNRPKARDLPGRSPRWFAKQRTDGRFHYNYHLGSRASAIIDFYRTP
jgi:hypothetical protein